AIGQRLGVNVGTLVGHSAVRLYAMGKDCSERPATDAELETMRRIVREALEAGALGLSITRNMNHFDIAGTRIPAACAPESELFALADVLREVGTGVIQCGGGTNPELKDRLLSRLAQACGRPVMYNTLLEQARQPGRWRTHLAHVEETRLAENRALKGRSIAAIAQERGKDPLDAFLDLAVEEELNTVFSLGEINMDTDAVAQILGSPYAVVGLSDGGAHVQFHSNVS